MSETGPICAGVDAGTECVKAVVLVAGKTIAGRAVVPMRGYFPDVIREALGAALDEAQIQAGELAGTCATGFACDCVPEAIARVGGAVCHALGAFHHFPEAMSIIDLGGREPRVIHVDSAGRPEDVFTLRRCAVGLGTFLMYASRHLDVHPTQLQELAARVDEAAAIGSYCSVFASADVLERLREGYTREAIALGCLRSIAERVVEIGGFRQPLRVTGGVAEYFPGVIKAVGELTRMPVAAVPEPIQAGALGAAIKAHRTVCASAEQPAKSEGSG
jgi:predicted CoA-substrate-specific enzyme activase